jgi:hypothetical protein
MARRRDYAAEYQARKARLVAQGRTLYQKRNEEAKRLGYASLGDQRARRRGGDLTHADHAAHAKREGGRSVTNLGRGRWTFTTGNRPDGLEPIDLARLQATLDRAWRADVNVTITATWRARRTRRTGTAQAGGSYGVRVRGFHDQGATAIDSIEAELGAVGESELPGGATITSLSLYFFPAERREAA